MSANPSNPLSEIAFVTANPSQAVDQLNQFVLQKQAEQQNQSQKSAFSWTALQVRSLLGLFRVIWYVLSSEEERTAL